MTTANVTITETSRGYEVQFEYRPKIVAEIKSMPGYRFHGKDKGWLIPHIGVRKNADGTTTSFPNKEAMAKFISKYTSKAEG